jgi:hypothetical protein
MVNGNMLKLQDVGAYAQKGVNTNAEQNTKNNTG